MQRMFYLITIMLLLTVSPAWGGIEYESTPTDTPFSSNYIECGAPAPSFAYMMSILARPPVHGTISDGGTVVVSPAEELEQCGTSTGSQQAWRLIYTPDSGYVGLDEYMFIFPESHTEIVYMAVGVPTAFASSSIVTALQNLVSSVHLTTNLITGRTASLFVRRATGSLNLHSKNTPPESITIHSPTMPGFAPEESTLVMPEKNLFGDILDVQFTGNSLGVSAGGAVDKHGIWFNLGLTATDDDSLLSQSDSKLNTYVFGYDYMLSDNMAIGVAVTYERMSMTTDFNLGELDSDGYTIAPYFAWLLTDYLSMDMIVGYTTLDYDQSRGNGFVTGDLEATRQFLQINGYLFHYIDNWGFTGTLTYLYAHEDQDSFIESNEFYVELVTDCSVNFSQFSLGAEVAYSFKHIEPYITLTFERDIQYEELLGTSYDESGGEGGVGLRISFMENLSGEINASIKFGRQDYAEQTLLGNVRYTF